MEPTDHLTRDRLTKLLEEFRSDGPGENTKSFNQALITEFRRTGGIIGGELGGPEFAFLLLTAKGAKSGRNRTVPLGYVKVEGRLYILASKGGSDTDPLWFRNVSANPEVVVELRDDTFSARAVVLEREERDRVFEAIVAKAPMFGDYQSRTSRPIPVVELQRTGPAETPSDDQSD